MASLPPLTDDVVSRLEVAGPRYTSYPTAPEWSDAFGHGDHVAALARAAADPRRPLSLYVHIPFCREMCTYCGCNVIATRDPSKADRYLDVLEDEIQLVAARLGARRNLSRLHLGGGTPTFLDEAQLERLWRALTARFTVLPDAEVAIEIDPAVTRTAQLALLAGFGFRRLSMGVQDFDPEVQRAVNRIQTVHETRAMVEQARALGFESVNFDLIYGLPKQTPSSWTRTLGEVVALRPDRVAAFSFAWVPEVKPHQRRLPVADIPRGRAKLELFRLAHDTLEAAGYRAIGMDHFALASDELSRAQAEGRLWRDFQGYTVERAADTVALGVSAISDVGGAYAQNTRVLSQWEAAIRGARLPTARGMRLGDEDRLRRAVITDLMCNFAVELGPEGAAHFASELDALAPLEHDGLVERRGTAIALTPLGRLFVRNVAMVFDAYLPRARAEGRRVFSSTV